VQEKGEAKMGTRRHVISGLTALVLSLAVAGCSARSEEELKAAQAEAAQAKTQLETVQAALAQIQTEKDQLSAKVATLTSELEKVKNGLADAIKERDGFQEQIKKLTGDQAGAAAQAEKESQTIIANLKAQLAALTAKFTDLQAQNGKLQEIIKELQAKLQNVGTSLIPPM
jgi:chromosome segregation ATPase